MDLVIQKKMSLTFTVLVWIAGFLIRAQSNGIILIIATKKIVAIIMVLLVFRTG
jgi:hypothetical protein